MSLTRAALLQKIAADLDPTDAKHVLDQLFLEISESLCRGETVKLTNFGSFIVSDSPQRIARNPKTSEPAVVEAHRRITFRASTSLKERVASAKNKSEDET